MTPTTSPFEMVIPDGFDRAEIVISCFDSAKGGDYLTVLPVKQYPDGMPFIECAEKNIETMLLRPKSLTTFMAAMFFVDALRERGQEPPSLLLPFVPGARQDRINPAGDFLFTAKSVADEINRRRFHRVTVIDPHSNVTPALINNCHVITAADVIKLADLKYDGVISSDAGAEHRAGDAAKALGVPLLHGWKVRDVATGKLTGFGLQHIDEDLEGKHFLIVDDICDGGGTFRGLYSKIEEAGITADLYTTHGIYSQGLRSLLDVFNKVITTDTYISGEMLDTNTPDAQTNRLHKRIIEAREDRWQVIPICQKLILEGF